MAQAITDKILTREFNKKLYNAVDKEFWRQSSKNDSSRMDGTNQLTIPEHDGSIPQYTIDSSLDWNSLSLNEVSHTRNQYSIEVRGFGPVLVSVLDNEELMYDKAMEVQDQMLNDSIQFLAEKIVHNWLNDAGAYVVQTDSSAAQRDNVYGNTVYKLTYGKFLAAQQILDEQKVPREGRVFVANSRFMQDVKEMPEFDNSDRLTTEIVSNGTVPTLDGVKLIRRETDNMRLDSTLTKPSFGVSPTNTDLAAGILYHPDFVRHAVGTRESKEGAKFVVRYPAKTAGAPVYEGFVRVGGTRSYSSDEGLVTIAEQVAV